MPTDADLATGALLMGLFFVGTVVFWVAMYIYVVVRDALRGRRGTA